MNKVKRILSALLAMMLILVAAMPILGADEFPDIDRKGSITVRILSSDTKAPVPGGKLEVYHVATVEIDNGFKLAYTEDFAGAGVDISENAALSSADAENLKTFADNAKLTGISLDISANGEAVLNDAELGLYLIVQKEAGEGFVAIAPFLVTVPYDDPESGHYIYDVDASPKIEAAKKISPATEANPPVRKAIKGSGAPKDTVFQFKLERMDDSYPMPVNELGFVSEGGPVVEQKDGYMILQIKGAGEVEAGVITFTAPGEYYYKISEVNTGAKNYTFDTTQYFYKYTVKEENGSLVCEQIIVREDGSEGKIIYEGENNPGAVEFTFTNIYEEPTTSDKTETTTVQPTTKKRLEPTGQAWWPVVLLVGFGIVCVIAGIVSRRKSKR